MPTRDDLRRWWRAARRKAVAVRRWAATRLGPPANAIRHNLNYVELARVATLAISSGSMSGALAAILGGLSKAVVDAELAGTVGVVAALLAAILDAARRYKQGANVRVVQEHGGDSCTVTTPPDKITTVITPGDAPNVVVTPATGGTAR